MRAGPTGNTLMESLWSLQLELLPPRQQIACRMLVEFRRKWTEHAVPPVKVLLQRCYFLNEETFIWSLHQVGNFTRFVWISFHTQRDNVFPHTGRRRFESLRNYNSNYLMRYLACVLKFHIWSILREGLERSHEDSRDWFRKTSNRLRDSVCILHGMYSVVKLCRWTVRT